MKQVPTDFKINTQRLNLRKHQISNFLKMRDWENDSELLYYNDCQPLNKKKVSFAEAQKYVQELIENESKSFIHYAIYKRIDNSFIGFGSIAFIDYYNKSCKLSIVIGEKSEWGQGYAKEALNVIIQYCFQKIKVNRIGAEIYSFNKRSIRLFKSLGFKKEGVIREAVKKKMVLKMK